MFITSLVLAGLVRFLRNDILLIQMEYAFAGRQLTILPHADGRIADSEGSMGSSRESLMEIASGGTRVQEG